MLQVKCICSKKVIKKLRHRGFSKSEFYFLFIFYQSGLTGRWALITSLSPPSSPHLYQCLDPCCRRQSCLASRRLRHTGTLSKFSVRTSFVNSVCIFLSHIKILITPQGYSNFLLEIFKGDIKDTITQHNCLYWSNMIRQMMSIILHVR